MLRLTAFEFIFRALPEAFLFIFAGFVFSNNKINAKKYIISSILLAICIYFIRMLPINYGVNTILVIIIQTAILTSINKIDVIKSIKSAIVVAICLFILEALNVLMLSIIFKEQFNAIMLNPILKIIYGLPSLIGFIIIISCYYISKKGKIK
jgi:hypothetical protein